MWTHLHRNLHNRDPIATYLSSTVTEQMQSVRFQHHEMTVPSHTELGNNKGNMQVTRSDPIKSQITQKESYEYFAAQSTFAFSHIWKQLHSIRVWFM